MSSPVWGVGTCISLNILPGRAAWPKIRYLIRFMPNCGQLDDLEPLGNALARFVRALDPKGTFRREGQQWVYRPDNFVTFSIHYKRTKNIVLSLRGHSAQYKEPAEKAGLTDAWRDLEHGMREYSRYRITSVGHLLAAAYFIRLAFDYPSRGRKRSS